MIGWNQFVYRCCCYYIHYLCLLHKQYRRVLAVKMTQSKDFSSLHASLSEINKKEKTGQSKNKREDSRLIYSNSYCNIYNKKKFKKKATKKPIMHCPPQEKRKAKSPAIGKTGHATKTESVQENLPKKKNRVKVSCT